MHSFSTLSFDSEKLEPQIKHSWNFRRQHTCYAGEDEFVELNDKSSQLEISKHKTEFVNASHFW